MKLIQVGPDVFVAADVSAVMLENCTVQVLLRGDDEAWETDFDTEAEAVEAIRAATQILLQLP